MELVEEIDSFIGALKERHYSINQLQSEHKLLDSHKKTLLFSLIETMAKSVFGEMYPSKATAFQKFILDFCEWEDAESVSLQQLALLLEDDESRRLDRLREVVYKELGDSAVSSPLPFSHDYKISQVRALMPRSETKVAGVDIYALKHVDLLWKNRNTLVHEGHTKDLATRSDLEDYPHYMHFTRWNKYLEVEYEVFKICYPVNFFNFLIENGLKNMREYLVENEVNPRDHFDFGELWVKRPRRGS